MKTYLHKPSKVFLFLTCGKIQKYLNVYTTLLEVRKTLHVTLTVCKERNDFLLPNKIGDKFAILMG